MNSDMAAHNVAGVTGRKAFFATDLFAVGDTPKCLFAWCCTPCAMADARTHMDGSDFCFNLLCMNPVATRWLVRSAYNIGDTTTCFEDFFAGVCCTCCAVNQMYQTVYQEGPIPKAGKVHNKYIRGKAPTGECARCVEACCCMQCGIGRAMHQGIGAPFLLGCCAMNLCVAHNIVRYHYRIKPHNSDCYDECLFPSFVYGCGMLCSPICPCLLCGVFAMFIQWEMEVTSLVEARVGHGQKAYLVGYDPTPAQNVVMNVNVQNTTVQNNTTVVMQQPGANQPGMPPPPYAQNQPGVPPPAYAPTGGQYNQYSVQGTMPPAAEPTIYPGAAVPSAPYDPNAPPPYAEAVPAYNPVYATVGVPVGKEAGDISKH